MFLAVSCEICGGCFCNKTDLKIERDTERIGGSQMELLSVCCLLSSGFLGSAKDENVTVTEFLLLSFSCYVS